MEGLNRTGLKVRTSEQPLVLAVILVSRVGCGKPGCNARHRGDRHGVWLLVGGYAASREGCRKSGRCAPLLHLEIGGYPACRGPFGWLLRLRHVWND